MVNSETGRGGAMLKYYKNDAVRDVMRTYFNSALWEMKWGDPVPSAPLDVQLEFVNRCNLHCVACDIHDLRRDKSMLEWEHLTALVDQAGEMGVCYFTVCGMGEATLHPELFAFFGYLRGKKVAPTTVRQFDFMPSILISNGMWSSTQVEQCIENPPDVLSLSLAGLTDAEFIERRGGISLKQFRKNVERLYHGRKVRRAADGGYSPTIHVATHIYPHEMETRHDDIERFKARWFEVADVVVIKVTVVKQGNNTTFTQNPVRSGHLRYNDIGDDHYERSAPCFETSRRLSVNSDGNVWCGHHLSENFGPLLGNIKQQTLREIWFGEAMNEFRREVRAGVFNRPGCRSCGGEIRDFHRNPSKVIEAEIRFS